MAYGRRSQRAPTMISKQSTDTDQPNDIMCGGDESGRAAVKIAASLVAPSLGLPPAFMAGINWSVIRQTECDTDNAGAESLSLNRLGCSVGHLTGANSSGWIPIFHNGKLGDCIERRRDPLISEAFASKHRSGFPRDVWIQLCLTHALHRAPWIDPDHTRLSVKNGIVHLTGQVDSPQGIQVLREIGAAIPDTTAIVDDLWRSSEKPPTRHTWADGDS